MPRYVSVRAMNQTDDDFNAFFEESVIAVGWSAVDFSSFEEVESLVRAVDERYYQGRATAPSVRGKKLNEVRRFKRLKTGDRVVVPFYSSIRLAVVEGREIYSPEVGSRLDLANQREVDYVRTNEGLVSIPRTELTHGLQRRLRVRGSTVSDLLEFADELEPIFRGESSGWRWKIQAEVERLEKAFKAKLLRNLQTGRTRLKAGGRGLEELVRELLEIEGYDADILSKRAFPGFADADIRASRSDRFSDTRLLVQVKHHHGQSGSWGAEQLAEILRVQANEYADDSLVLVTSGDASRELATSCSEYGISLVDGPGLVDWLFDCWTNLRPDTRADLGILELPQLIS